MGDLIRNNLLFSSIKRAGYSSLFEFALAAVVPKSALSELVAMKTTPIHHKTGSFTDLAKAIMECLGAAPTDLWTSEQLYECVKSFSTGDVYSSDELFSQNVDALTLSDPETDCVEIQKRKILFRLVESTLDLREKKIIQLRLSDLTYEEIGYEFGISAPRVRQLESRAYLKVRYDMEKAGYARNDF